MKEPLAWKALKIIKIKVQYNILLILPKGFFRVFFEFNRNIAQDWPPAWRQTSPGSNSLVDEWP